MDSDLKIMLHGLPSLRIPDLTRYKDVRHEFTDNTCGLIARKCPGLQALYMDNHDHLSMKGIRKIFEGCVHLRSFVTSTIKLGYEDIKNLLSVAPQLLFLTLDSELGLTDEQVSDIVEATGGRTLIRFFRGYDVSTWDPEGRVSVESSEKYEHRKAVFQSIRVKRDDIKVSSEWEDMLGGGEPESERLQIGARCRWAVDCERRV